MQNSAAKIVKSYFEKYIYIHQIKTKRGKYSNPLLARKILSIAYDISHKMDDLIRSNNSNDLDAIKSCLREKTALLHDELKPRTWFKVFCKGQPVPTDFGLCVNEAWYKIQFMDNRM